MGRAATLLAVVDLQRLANVDGKCGIEVVFQLVDVVVGGALADVVKQLLVMVFDPAIDTLPRVRHWGRRRKALVEVLHLDLTIGSLIQ